KRQLRVDLRPALRIGTDGVNLALLGTWRNITAWGSWPAVLCTKTPAQPLQPSRPDLFSRQNPALRKELKQIGNRVLRRFFSRVDRQFRLKRGFVRIVNAGEAHPLTVGEGLPRLLVEPLRVALFAHINCRIYMDFNERNRSGFVLLVDRPGRI